MERSLLLVHAHPDDESIGTGATMAKYAAEGARVTLVTCTLGELGEIIPPDLRHLLPDELGQHRIGELDRACAALGVDGPPLPRRRGPVPRLGDDGPAGQRRPALLLAGRRRGGGGRARQGHRGGRGRRDRDLRRQRLLRASRSHPGPPGHRARARAGRADREAVRDRDTPLGASKGRRAARGLLVHAEIPICRSACPTTRSPPRSTRPGYLDAKRAAMRAHETQITVDGDYFALSNELGAADPRHRVLHTARGPAPPTRNDRYERDLFAR